MNKDLIKQQVMNKLKPKARPLARASAEALLAKYGQKYNPGGSASSSSDGTASAE